MTASPESLERLLSGDLDQVAGELADDKTSTELYLALANNRWHKAGGPDGAVSLSWSRAEAMVNELRERAGRPPLSLAQRGGEGTISDTIRVVLDRLGWSAQPLNTGRHDEAHVEPERGEPQTEPDHRWEREAHAEAERNAR